MPDGAEAVAGQAVGMVLNWNKGFRAIPRSKDRGCGLGQDAEDRRLKPGRVVRVEDLVGDREWDAAWDVGLVAPQVWRYVWAEVAGRAVVIREHIYVHIARERGVGLSYNAGP